MKKLRTVFYIVAGFASTALLASVMFTWTFGWAFADTVAFSNPPSASGYSTAVAYPPDSNTYRIAYPFTPTVSGNLTAIATYAAGNSSSAPFDLQTQIYSDSSGAPGSLLESGSVIAASSLVNASSVSYNTASFTFATSTFSGTTALTAGTQYWAVYTYSVPGGGSFNPGWSDDILVGCTSSTSCGDSATWRGTLSSWTEANTQASLALSVYVGSGGGGGGGSATSTSPFSYITATTSYAVIDNPTQDFFNGIVCFFLGFLGMIWLLRKH